MSFVGHLPQQKNCKKTARYFIINYLTNLLFKFDSCIHVTMFEYVWTMTSVSSTQERVCECVCS